MQHPSNAVWPVAALAALLMLTSSALPCSDHEDPAMGRDRLAANYPGALEILPTVVAARREKLLPPANPMAALFVDKFPLQRHIRLLEHFEGAVNAAAGGAASISFSLVLIEPMLWSRYAPAGGSLRATVHTDGADPGELVVIAPEDVIVIIGDGKLTLAQAQARGLVGIHGDPAQVAQFLSLYGNAGGDRRAALENPLAR
jgi:hypothetical protein